MVFAFVLLALLSVGAAYLLYRFRRERARAIAALSPQQRELRDARADYDASVKAAEQAHRKAVKEHQNRLGAAQKSLQWAKEEGRRSLGSLSGRNGTVRLYQDRIETPQASRTARCGPP